ncbi:hypothetical protein B9Z19DRAFT_428304 [Tuber borchii]|uniref:Uncharacterized protein n=1 Tax=Tuber borchii TaxID=42251 RepID=A0A2T7A3P0_TUBBO|nr:hypothetical protein B9Z19DRAFT_428304 [Tuber borchii]
MGILESALLLVILDLTLSFLFSLVLLPAIFDSSSFAFFLHFLTFNSFDIYLSFLLFIRSIRSLYHFLSLPLLSLRSGFIFLPLFTWSVRSPSPSSCNLRVMGSSLFSTPIYLFIWLLLSYVPCALVCDSNYLNYLALGGWRGEGMGIGVSF